MQRVPGGVPPGHEITERRVLLVTEFRRILARHVPLADVAEPVASGLEFARKVLGLRRQFGAHGMKTNVCQHAVLVWIDTCEQRTPDG